MYDDTDTPTETTRTDPKINWRTLTLCYSVALVLIGVLLHYTLPIITLTDTTPKGF